MQRYNVDTDHTVEQLWDTRSIGIDGMTCANCVKQVQKALKRVNGVKDVKVDLDTASATVTFDTTKTDMPALHDALLQSGYRPKHEVVAE
jgi:copper ion binding protein